jgi:hypothetical protein
LLSWLREYFVPKIKFFILYLLNKIFLIENTNFL